MPLLEHITRRNAADLLLSIEALALLTVFRVSLSLLPFRRILRAITHQQPGLELLPETESPSALVVDTAIRVRWAIEAVSRNSPARFVCFPQSLAAYVMLRRRHIPATIVYGVGHSHTGQLIAHTWLALGDRIVVGGEGSEAFEPIERWA